MQPEFQDTKFQRTSGEARRTAYLSYLSSIASELPADTAAFVLSDWYYSDSDRNPHDGWVESIEVRESASGERRQIRSIYIELHVLSAWHKANIVFRYNEVVNYDIEGLSNKHGDWLSDEITLDSEGTLTHEIVFSTGAKWKIRSKSVSYEYVPISGA